MKKNLFLMAVLLFCYLLLKDSFPLAGMVILLWYCQMRTKDKSWIILALCMMLTLLPHWDMQRPEMTDGVVTDVKASYVIIRSGRTKLLLYTNESVDWGDRVSFVVEPKLIVSAVGMYRSGFDAYCHRQGVYYSARATKIEVLQHHRSLRSYLREKCEGLDKKARVFAKKFLLGISTAGMEDSFFYIYGASLAAVAALIQSILRFFVVKRKRDIIMIILYAVLALFFGMPMMLVQGLLFRVLSFFNLTSDERIGLGYLLLFTIFPSAVFTPGIMLPAIYRISGRFFRKTPFLTPFISAIVQNLFFQKIDPIGTFVYMHMRPVIGAVWICTFASVLVSSSGFAGIIAIFDNFLSFLQYTALPGSILGMGSVFYVLCVVSFGKEHRWRNAYILLLLFQLFGLFHPFAEISFINVGQGDSILVRAPLNSGNVLIDTGKPNAYDQVETFLHAKCVRKLDALIISHSDDDHDGNKDKIIENFRPETVLEEKHEPFTCGGIRYTDVNPIVNDDTNQSSLTEYFGFNGMSVLMTGDIDAVAEEAILAKYNALSSSLLKAAHHGSSTSSSEAFLDVTRPEIAVISSGPFNMYHHPSPEVIQRLLKRHIPYVHTLVDGDITVLAIGRRNILFTASGKIWLLKDHLRE